MLSLFQIKQILHPVTETLPTDDFRILDSWAEYDENSSKDPEKRNLQYLCYEMEVMNPSTGERIHCYKAIKMARVIRLPADAKQSTALMDMQEQVLTAVNQQNANLITIIANVLKPVAVGLLYIYGIQGVASTINKAKEKAKHGFLGFVGSMQGTFRVLEMRCANAEETEWLREKMYNMDWDYNIPVTCYARNADTLKLAAEKGISCYGIVKSASQLIDAIHNNSVITIQPERNRSKVENSREKTLSTSRMPSVNSESFRDNRPERVPDNRKDSIVQKKSVLSDDIYTGAVQYEEENEGEDIIESRERARVKRPSQVQHSEPIARNAENTRYYQKIPASRKTPVMEEDTDDSNQEEDDYTLDLRSRMAKVREQEKIAEQKRKEEEKKKQESMLEKQISQEVGDTKKRAKIITVYSAKGGVGKTTISCELASYLALTEHGRDKFKVCIVDYNIDFGDVMGTLLYDPNKACMTLWADEIRGQLERMPVNKHGRHTKEQLNSIQYSATQIERFLQKNEASGLYALLAPTSNEDSMDISGEELEIMLNNIVENGGFDFVICDTGNNTRDSSYMTLLKADQVFLVLTQNFNTANCNNSLLKMLDALHFDMNKIGLIINKVQSKKSVGLGTDELEETFINPLTNKPYPCIALIKDTNDIRRASNNGEPLVYSPNNDFTKSIGKIVSQIVDEEHALEQPEKKGLFARLFGKRG